MKLISSLVLVLFTTEEDVSSAGTDGSEICGAFGEEESEFITAEMADEDGVRKGARNRVAILNKIGRNRVKYNVCNGNVDQLVWTWLFWLEWHKSSNPFRVNQTALQL